MMYLSQHVFSYYGHPWLLRAHFALELLKIAQIFSDNKVSFFLLVANLILLRDRRAAMVLKTTSFSHLDNKSFDPGHQFGGVTGLFIFSL